jgi:hypothetical protein
VRAYTHEVRTRCVAAVVVRVWGGGCWRGPRAGARGAGWPSGGTHSSTCVGAHPLASCQRGPATSHAAV